MAELITVPSADRLSEVVALARQAMKRRAFAESCRLWRSALAVAGCLAADYVDAAKAFREARSYNEAEDLLTEAAERFPDSETVAVARGWLANAQGDWAEAEGRWKSVQTRFPDNRWGFLGYIHALRGGGTPEKIDDVLPALARAVALTKQRGLDPTSALRLDLEVSKALGDWPQVYSQAKPMADDARHSSSEVLLALAQACWHLGQNDEADQAALQALSVDPSLSEAVVVRAWIATARGDGEAALSCYRRLAELNPTAVRWPLKVIQLLNRTGHVRDALVELERVRQRWSADPMVKVFLQNYGPAAGNNLSPEDPQAYSESMPGRLEDEELRALDAKAPGPAEWKRPPLVPDGGRDVLIVEAPNAEVLLLVFAGSNDAVSMPLPLFDRFLAKLDLSVIYLKDFRRLRFLTGIDSLSDSYEGTLAALRETIDRMGIKRVCTLGNCDGGFAAIRYGVELRAERVVTFGAPTHAFHDPSTKMEQARNIMKNRLRAKVPDSMMNLKAFLESREYETRIDFFYEQQDARDSAHAQHLYGVAGVHPHPQPGISNHYLLRQLALRQDDFTGFLGRLLALDASSYAGP